MKPIILFPHKENIREILPQYADIADVTRRILNTLNDHSPGTWMHVYAGDAISQLDSHLLELMDSGKLRFDTLAFVYETRSLATISRTADDAGGGRLKISNAFENRVIYFPEYDVAVAQVMFYTNSENSWPELQCYAKSAEAALRFLEAVNDKLRQMLMHSVTYLVDTDEGVERRNYGTHAVVDRQDVLLEKKLKEAIFRSIDEFFREDGQFFKDYGLPYKRGILLYGPPGNGKTTLVKSITGSTAAPVVYWQITEYTNSYTIQEVFGIVSRFAPAILVIEDIDSIPAMTRSVFLNALDGTQSRDGLFVIGTTNYPERIDPALINRAGRFDRAYEIKAPNKRLRANYLRKLDVQNIFSSEETDEIAALTKGLSVSQLNELYMSSALNLRYEGTPDYQQRIQELQQQNKRAEQNNWEEEETSFGFQ